MDIQFIFGMICFIVIAIAMTMAVNDKPIYKEKK